MAVASRPPLSVWAMAVRPKTLWAAVAPVLIGTALALEDDAFHALSAACALVAAVLIQVGTNFSNDYADFLKGADTSDRKGPLRVTQAGLVSPASMRRATLATFALAVVAGSYLMWRGGWPVVIIGALSIASGLLYTVGRYSLAYLGIADLFVLIFFGPVAVGGTYYVQALTVNALVLLAGLGPGLLAVAILFVNNIRDVDEDRAAGKKTPVVRLGRAVGVRLYQACVVLAALVPVGLYVATGRHPLVLLAVFLVPLGLRNARQMRGAAEPRALNPLLGATSKLLLFYSVLFSLGWLLS